MSVDHDPARARWSEAHQEFFTVAHPIRDQLEGQNVMAGYDAGKAAALRQLVEHFRQQQEVDEANWSHEGVIREAQRLLAPPTPLSDACA